MRLFEITGLTFREEVRGYHHGQSDRTLYAYRAGVYVGHIDYVVYNDEPSVQMIEVPEGNRRQGVGTALLHKLQSMFPDTEIEMGYSTDLGNKLLGSIPTQRIENPEYASRKARLDALQAIVDDWQRQTDAMHAAGELDRLRAFVKQHGDDWNAANTKIWELENELRAMRPAKTLLVKPREGATPTSP